MLLRRHAGHRLEPVRVMGGAFLDGPVLHRIRDHFRRGGTELTAFFDRLLQIFIDLPGEALTHHPVIEYILAEYLIYRMSEFHLGLLLFLFPVILTYHPAVRLRLSQISRPQFPMSCGLRQ